DAQVRPAVPHAVGVYLNRDNGSTGRWAPTPIPASLSGGLPPGARRRQGEHAERKTAPAEPPGQAGTRADPLAIRNCQFATVNLQLSIPVGPAGGRSLT